MKLCNHIVSEISKPVKINLFNPLQEFKKLICTEIYGLKKPHGLRPRTPIAGLRPALGPGAENRFALTDEMILAHTEGLKTYYYYSAASGTGCGMLDWDCGKSQKKGTPEGCRQSAAAVKTTFFPDLFLEPSTSADGMHGFFKFIMDRDPETCRESLMQLKKALNLWCQGQGHDIEKLEITGTPAKIYQDDEKKWHVDGYGLLAKIPRGLLTDEFANTTVLKISEIPDLVTKIQADTPYTAPQVQSVGSMSLFNQSDIDNFAKFVALGNKLAPSLNGQMVYGHKITAEDVGLFLLVTKSAKEHPYEDNSFAINRAKSLWNMLIELGISERAWNHNRFKVIRDKFTELGYLDWLDHRYWIGNAKNKGIACKWSISPILHSIILDYINNEKYTETHTHTTCCAVILIKPVLMGLVGSYSVLFDASDLEFLFDASPQYQLSP